MNEPGIWKCSKQNSVLSRGNESDWGFYDFDKKNKKKFIKVIKIYWKYFLVNRSENTSF